MQGGVTDVDEADADRPDGQMHIDGFSRWTLRAIAPTPDRVPYVRQQVLRVLRLWKLQELAFTVELAINELVTNAVRHARTPFTVTLAWDGQQLRGEVIDANPGRPLLQLDPGMDQLGGRGLFMVEQLVAHWGWRRHGQGKVVYFQVLPPRGGATATS